MSSMLGFDQAREKILQRALLCKSAQRETLAQALGRILAEDIVAPISVPLADNSAMDGIAFFSDGVTPAGTLLPISMRIPAGTAPKPLQPGTAARIFTGALIPQGANCVVPQEALQAVETAGQDTSPLAPGSRVKLTSGAVPGQNVRKAGSDIQQGQPVLQRGTRLNPQALGLLASLGIARANLYQQLRVGIVCTGDELVAPGEPLAPGQLYDANSTLLAGLVRQCSMQPQVFSRLPDNLEATCEALQQAASGVDVLISSGGVSVGEEDHVQAALQRIGQVDFWRVAVKPGKPLLVGRIGDTPFFGLPGNPVSSFVTFLMLVLPFLKLSAGEAVSDVSPLLQPAAFDREPGGRTEFLRARLQQGRVHIYPDQGSAILGSVQWAQGLVRQDAGQKITQGDPVAYFSIESLL